MSLKTEKLIDLLSGGEQFTIKQITKKTGLKCPSRAIAHLREAGVRIYTNKRRLGRKVKHYYRAPTSQFWVQI